MALDDRRKETDINKITEKVRLVPGDKQKYVIFKSKRPLVLNINELLKSSFLRELFWKIKILVCSR